MASPPPPPPPPSPPAPTTISALNDDLLREIFLRLPAVTSLARAAFSCRAFLRAVRSSPAFRRHFRELHAPPLLALFLVPYMEAFVPAAGGKGSFDRTFTNLFQDDAASEWHTEADCDGYVCFLNRTTEQCASYSPHSQALKIYPNPDNVDNDTYLEFHTLSPDAEEQRPSRVVCVHHERSWAWARVAVFSSHTMEWQILPETGTLLLEGDTFTIGTVVSGFVCWAHTNKGCILTLSTATFQFSIIDLPPPLRLPFSRFLIGQTRDGKLCIVNVNECNLSVWLQTADDGVERFMLHKMFSLHTTVKEVTERSQVDNVEVELMMVTNGFVYLSVYYRESQSFQWFLSFCLETAEVNLLHKESIPWHCPVDPYIMTSWPSSLIHNKNLETGVTGDISEDGPISTEETSRVLFTALHSFKETLIDGDNVNFVEMDAFLLDDEKNSLVNRITTLESSLTTARDRVLRIGTNSITNFINRKGMEGGSWWQMCKGRLGRVWSQFFTS